MLIGGYAQIYPGQMRDHPGFSAQTLVLDTERLLWEKGPILPPLHVDDRDSSGDRSPAPMMVAPAAEWQNHVVVISGESRASVRTPAVIAWPLSKRR